MSTPEIQSLRSRPRFRRYLKANPENVLNQFATKIKARPNLTGSVATHHVSIRISKAEVHFWSPQLGLEVENHPNGTLIRGLYGPKPGIWTMFIFVYAVFGVGTLAMLFWGLSQWQIGQYAWALWFVPGGVLTLGGIYLLTQFGQKLGYDQMDQIHALFKDCIDEYEQFEPEEL
ncbi:MAG: hypothetical protein ACPGLV_07160 [Bacteroidia bacterium]